MSKSETFLEDKKEIKQLEEELGKGVEKDPEPKPKPSLEIKKLDLSGAFTVSDIVKELEKLPTSENVTKQLDKFDEYLENAKRIWTAKQSDKDSFDIAIDIKRDEDGKPIPITKTFYYNAISLQDKDKLIKLQLIKANAANKMTAIGLRLRQHNKATDDKIQDAIDYLEKENITKYTQEFYDANKNYYVTGFQMYYGVTAEQMTKLKLSMEDIIDYTDIALRKEGVRSPQ